MKGEKKKKKKTPSVKKKKKKKKKKKTGFDYLHAVGPSDICVFTKMSS